MHQLILQNPGFTNVPSQQSNENRPLGALYHRKYEGGTGSPQTVFPQRLQSCAGFPTAMPSGTAAANPPSSPHWGTQRLPAAQVSQCTPRTSVLSLLLQGTVIPRFKVPGAVHQGPEGTASLTQILHAALGQLIAKNCCEGRAAGRLSKDLPLPWELFYARPLAVTPPEPRCGCSAWLHDPAGLEPD